MLSLFTKYFVLENSIISVLKYGKRSSPLCGNWSGISELAKLICLSVNLELFSVFLLSSKARELHWNHTHTSVKFTEI